MSNSLVTNYLTRLIAIEADRRAAVESRKGLIAEMESKLPAHECMGIELRAKWHFQSEKQAAKRPLQQMAFDFASSLGELRQAA